MPAMILQKNSIMIKKRLQTSVYSALALLLGFCLKAQEQLMPLNANAQLLSAPAKNTKAARTATLAPLDTIPFFEDFSYSPTSPYPTVNHWIDSNVFINHTFPIAPPSIGVATFDGLNKKGYPYNLSALVSNSSQADKLTSRPINLQKKGPLIYQPLDSIYLSFYYQAEGRGDAPEPNDSLSVDFYKPNQKKWEKVWGRKGYNPSGADSLFHLVMLPIKDTAYFDSLFQFRFRNRATLSGSLDHWHVDYIYLDKNRSRVDTSSFLEDVAFEYMSTPFLKNYSTMPYRQYVASEMATKIRSYQRNNFSNVKYGDYTYAIYDKNNVLVYPYTNTTPDNIYPYSQIGTNTVTAHSTPTVGYTFPAMTDMNVYTIKHTVFTNPDLHRQNDTIWQTQRFSDYYAYDDGSAEVGYYNNTYGAMNAVRYTLNAPDTLRALRIYFDPVTDGQNIINSTFNIMVWNDGTNGPGSLIYSDSTNNESKPVYLQGGYNLMPTYPLSQCLLLSPGTYYVGIKQKSNRPLNVGFDKNTDHSNAFYYDIGNGWVQSAIKGSIMINPLMGCLLAPLPTNITEPKVLENSLLVFPNPAQNNINIEVKGPIAENAGIVILSSIGQTVYSAPYTAQGPVDVSALSNGVYVIQLMNGPAASPVITKKLIIAR